MSNLPSLLITHSDFTRLSRLLDGAGDGVDMLAEELMRAVLVPRDAVPSSVATMNSVVVYEDTSNGARRRVKLVYPRDANAAAGSVSVLAPVGCALLGLSVGQAIEWDVPSARRRFRVLEIAYQPEAAGDAEL